MPTRSRSRITTSPSGRARKALVERRLPTELPPTHPGEMLLKEFLKPLGISGLKRAAREVFPHARRQRCQVHKMRNLLAKLSKLARAQMKRLVQQVFLAPSYQAGLKRGKALIARFRARYPDAMACLEADLAECLAFLRFPAEHHKRIRTTNLIERTFEESRRRTKVVPGSRPRARA